MVQLFCSSLRPARPHAGSFSFKKSFALFEVGLCKSANIFVNSFKGHNIKYLFHLI